MTKGVGAIIIHKRYGRGEVTNIWYKLINPRDGSTVVDGITFKLLSSKGKQLFNQDRSYNGTLSHTPLRRCYENNFKLLSYA